MRAYVRGLGLTGLGQRTETKGRLRPNFAIRWLVSSGLLVPVFGLLALSSGCANYQLGTGSTPGFRTLFIEPVRVEALLPQSQVVVGTQLRETFLRDGRVRLVGSAEEADAVLRLVLDRYERAVATVRPDDTGLARRFDVELAGRATLTDRRTGKAIFENRPLVARRGVFADSGLVPAEYQNLPVLAQDLARQAQQAVLDTW